MSSSTDPQRIVVAVDGSPSSTVAADWAARDAALRHVPLTLVHVSPEPAIGLWPEPILLDDYSTWRDEHGRKVLDDASRVADRAILDVKPIGVNQEPIAVNQESYAGPVIPTLVDLSKDAAMIVVGRRGMSGVKRRLLGSVSAGLAQHAHCPVAVIHDEDPMMNRPAHAPVLVGIDGSPTSEKATAIAFDEASRRGVELIAMHSWADEGLRDWASTDWDRQLEVGKEALSERLAGWRERYPDVTVDHRLVTGNPADRLIVASESAQLTVVGSHGRGGFTGMLLGSVSSAVLQAARMPVIVARQG
jgi:nucleotide-binding universal stress UspA family protein